MERFRGRDKRKLDRRSLAVEARTRSLQAQAGLSLKRAARLDHRRGSERRPLPFRTPEPVSQPVGEFSPPLVSRKDVVESVPPPIARSVRNAARLWRLLPVPARVVVGLGLIAMLREADVHKIQISDVIYDARAAITTSIGSLDLGLPFVKVAEAKVPDKPSTPREIPPPERTPEPEKEEDVVLEIGEELPQKIDNSKYCPPVMRRLGDDCKYSTEASMTALGGSSTPDPFLCAKIPDERFGGPREQDTSHGCVRETEEPYVDFGVKRTCWQGAESWLCEDYLFSPGNDTDITPVMDACGADLAGRLGISPDQVRVIRAEFHEWHDAVLGCQPGQQGYFQEPIAGWILTLSVGGWEYTYHADGVCWDGFRWDPCPPETVLLCRRQTRVLLPLVRVGRTKP